MKYKPKNYMFLDELKRGKPPGVLDTPKKVRQAGEELIEVTRKSFEKLERDKRRSLEEAINIQLD